MNAMQEPSSWIGEEPAADNRKIEREQIKLEKRLCREVGRAVLDFNMIEEGDKIMVCMSGGKDSYTLLDILRKLQKRAPVKFDLVAVNLDQKQPGFPDHVLPDYFKSIGVDYHIETQDTYSVVKRVVPEGKTRWPTSWAAPSWRWATTVTTSCRR
jgi:tRNA 2-thiocytidine biosynthesis protein TtcA